jgi:hypothetical protein
VYFDCGQLIVHHASKGLVRGISRRRLDRNLEQQLCLSCRRIVLGSSDLRGEDPTRHAFPSFRSRGGNGLNAPYEVYRGDGQRIESPNFGAVVPIRSISSELDSAVPPARGRR